MLFQPSPTLKSRTYVGLITSQFLAAFNDQASHIVALFYATDMLVRFAGVPHVDSKTLISIVTACFILPFFLFSAVMWSPRRGPWRFHDAGSRHPGSGP